MDVKTVTLLKKL